MLDKIRADVMGERLPSIVKLTSEYRNIFGPARLADISADGFFPPDLKPSLYMRF